MISVVIPLYNKEGFIKEALDSVLNQTYKNFEVIVINDGSTDCSLDIVKRFDDDRLHIISIENSGVSTARNIGIENTKFDWIAFLDADDWWDPNFLSEIYLAIQEYPDEKIFTSGRSRVFENLTEPYQNEDLPEIGKIAIINYFKVIAKNFPPINSSNVVIHKSLFVINRFREGMKMHEDHDLWIRLCTHNDVVFINKNLSFYRKDIPKKEKVSAFLSKDFLQYIEDIKLVNNQISSKEKKYFRKYYTSFIPIRYFQFYEKYDKEERTNLIHSSKELLSFWSIAFLHFLNIISVFMPYKMFKRIKK